jgi:hypothetical protein
MYLCSETSEHNRQDGHATRSSRPERASAVDTDPTARQGNEDSSGRVEKSHPLGGARSAFMCDHCRWGAESSSFVQLYKILSGGIILMTAVKHDSRPGRETPPPQLKKLKRAIQELGEHAIDRRTTLGKALAQWRTDLVQDLGGPDAVSTQELAVVDLAVKTKLLLDSVDAWLLTQPSLVNARKRTLLAVVLQRQQLADALARYLTLLGLKRRQAPVASLNVYLATRKSGDAEAPDPAPPNPR